MMNINCMYSPSDLQEILLIDSELLKLIATYKAHETTVYGSGLYSGGGWVYDEDGNSYIIRHGFNQNYAYIYIGKATRTFKDIDEYRLWSSMLEKSTIINSFIQRDKDEEAQRNKSFWRKLYEFFS